MKFFRKPEYKFLFDLISPHKLALLAIAVLNLMLSGIGLVIPYLVKLQTDQLQAANTELFAMFSGSPVFIFILIVGIVITFNFLEQILGFLARFLNERIRQKFSLEAEDSFFRKLSGLDTGFLENPRNRRITNNIFNISYIYDRAFYVVPETIRNIFEVFGIVPVIFLIDYRIGFFTLAMSLIEYHLYHVKIKQENQMAIPNERLQQKIYDLRYFLSFHFQDILMVDLENKVLKTYREKRKHDDRFEFAKFKISEQWAFLFWLLSNLTTAAITIIFGYQVLQGAFTIGDFTMITLYALQLKDGFSGLFRSAGEWRSMEVDFLKLGFFLNLKPRFQLRKDIYKGKLSGDIVFRDVSFRYPGLDQDERKYVQYMLERQKIHKNKLKSFYYDEEEGKEWEKLLKEESRLQPLVLRNFNFSVKAGEITALIGRNGSGKTTAAQLILRSHEPSEGHISLGKVALKRLVPAHLRKFTSVLSQNVFLIDSFSIRDNLLLGVEQEVSDTTIWSLLERFYLKDKIMELPKKLDTVLGDDMNFSGGQRQLLAIVRTYLQNKPHIIFDEGTNQLDAEHESAVMDFLQERKASSTILMITHKLTSARKADQIHVLDQGTIIESGTHSQLIEQDGLYGKFWKLQVVD